MTKDEALKMAIEALEDYPYEHRTAKMDDALQACKEALEQPAQEHLCTYSRAINQQYPRKCIHCGKVEAIAQPAQEPVAWKHFDKAYSKACNSSQPQDWMDAALLAQQARNTHPAPLWQGNKEFVRLSDNEIFNLSQQCDLNHILGLIDYGRAIEQALKDKNT